MDRLQTISPIDGRVVVERAWASPAEIEEALEATARAFSSWRATPLAERIDVLRAFVDRAVADTDGIAAELAVHMGRPVRYGAGEANGWLERGHTMLDLAPEALGDVVLADKAGFSRTIERTPLGVVLVLAPWNYPWLTAVNALVPALAAGNTVLLKHSDQTPLVAERIAAAANAVGLPPGVLRHVHVRHEQVPGILRDERVSFVSFTGSTAGGLAVQSALQGRTAGLAMELGGKDPAYVCADAPIEQTAAALCEGAFFNSGQSCCAVERIYVQAQAYDAFVAALAEQTRALVLGDPRLETTTLGPVVRASNANAIRAQVDQALQAGARAHIDPSGFSVAAEGTPYMAPQVLTNVTHAMRIMMEETFGPVVGVMPVQDDAEAIKHMNDSRYGLTASIWTADLQRARALGSQIDTGTVFMNRCDALDPELAWVGVKNSGRGCTLSRLGYAQFTRPKSFHLRHEVP